MRRYFFWLAQRMMYTCTIDDFNEYRACRYYKRCKTQRNLRARRNLKRRRVMSKKLNLKKIRPMFNALVTTFDVYEDDDNTNVIINSNEAAGQPKPYQTV